MGPRMGKRTLGFAALVLAVLAAAFVVLLSHTGGPQAKPIDERAAKADHGNFRPWSQKDPIGKAIPNLPTHRKKVAKKRVKHRKHAVKRTRTVAQRGSAPAAGQPVQKQRRGHTKPRRSGAPVKFLHKGGPAPVTPSAAPTSAPVASPAPAPAASAPPAAAPAQPAPAPAVRPVEIRVEDGDLATGFNFLVYNRGDRVRLHVTSDQSIVVQIAGYGINQPVAAGGDALIEFDANSTGTYEVKAGRRLSLALFRVRD